MPESRDRLSRPADVTAMFSRRRQSIGAIAILLDEPEVVTRTPFRWGTTGITGTRGATGVAATRGGGVGRGSLRTPRGGNGYGRNLYGTPEVGGRRNSLAGSVQRGRGRGSASVLPSWYPRTPLRDVTAVVRAIERRRARLREIEGQQLENPLIHDQDLLQPSVLKPAAQLEHELSIFSPNPRFGFKPRLLSVGKVPKILLDITNQNGGNSECITPQKKLLNSIDTVEKVLMEELKNLKRTPSAKKAQRAERTRTLMSMR
ncbi:negative regulation of ubiquitin-protein transferase [Sarracenia purpurea var. burkii]